MSKLWSQTSSVSLVAAGFFCDIDISKIKQSKNILQRTLDINDLANSIRQKGLLQPILVRTIEGYFEIVAGNRRFKACKILGWKKVACHVVELDDRQAFEVSLIENIQRKRITSLEEGNAFKAYVSDYGWGGISELASRIGKSISYISKRIKLLNLPDDVIESITNRKLDISIAEELFSIKDKTKQSTLANLIANRRLSLRKSRKLLNDLNKKDLDFDSVHISYHIDHVRMAERSFDKAISAIRIAMNSLREIIESVDRDWILYEILMQHKNMLHSQIDILIKEKRKL